ncbi:MAG: Flp pilus assembly protein CpaB [Rhodospirillaceae bacterium]|jgi:pilus assembly protein CpaB|nr:Flp pilus assembly protein CpaB [Rhodospirillaceae bacterium]MBT5459697.1 Flp pilus assembly protein CpaB [Rhodospirillaceae bacterium]
MNPRTLLLAIAALTTAGLTAFLVQGWMEHQRSQMARAPEKAKPAGNHVLVAKKNIPRGRFIKPDELLWQAWPEGRLSPAYATKGERKKTDFVGSVVRNSLVAGQPVTDEAVVKAGERGFLAAVLTPGMRAVSVKVSAVSAISGLVFPGDRVDLILTGKFKIAGASKGERNLFRAAETVLTNVRILALDQRTDDQKGNDKAKRVPKTATFELTPKQVQMVSVARNLGNLSLSLRSLAKDDENGTKPDEKEDKVARRGKTVTRDTEVSRFLTMGANKKKAKITIMRGGKTSVATVAKEGPDPTRLRKAIRDALKDTIRSGDRGNDNDSGGLSASEADRGDEN